VPLGNIAGERWNKQPRSKAIPRYVRSDSIPYIQRRPVTVGWSKDPLFGQKDRAWRSVVPQSTQKKVLLKHSYPDSTTSLPAAVRLVVPRVSRAFVASPCSNPSALR
jgi:hypothetical protein